MKNHDPRLAKSYRALDGKLKLTIEGEDAIRPDLLITFPHARPSSGAEVAGP